ncbi:Mediator of RNA polymerase II transcription subunit 8 [Aphelenchoides fujianensis]|nr:Mediator of RNA polymerase II transcription subunit 8 [Aphelenchoides fujianensis]
MDRSRMPPNLNPQQQQAGHNCNPGALVCIDKLEQKLVEIKQTIRDLLVLLELQERVSYPEVLNNLFVLAENFSNVQEKLKKALSPAGATDDQWTLLRTHLLVPNAVDLTENPELLKETENRLSSWNHAVVPDYLRTQLAPRVIQQEQSMEKEGQLSMGNSDTLGKKISNFNKHVEFVTNGEASRPVVPSGPTVFEHQRDPQGAQRELERFVKAVMRGDGIKLQKPPPPKK